MDKLDYVFADTWLKSTVRFWLSATMPVDHHTAIAYKLLQDVADHYAVLTYYDGADLHIIAHSNLEKCITVSRNTMLLGHSSAWYSMGNGGLYVKSTPIEVKSAIERAMGRNSEDADNRAAKKSCALH